MQQNCMGTLCLWKSIHHIALGYPDNPTELDRRNYSNYYMNFEHVLPCAECRNHYKRHIQKMPIEESLGSKKDIFRWTVDLHNVVNKSLGKPLVSFDDAWLLYHSSNKETPTIYILGVVIVALVAFKYGCAQK